MGALLLSRGPPGQPHSRAGRGGDAEGWGPAPPAPPQPCHTPARGGGV